jgi:hypothetical protein
MWIDDSAFPERFMRVAVAVVALALSTMGAQAQSLIDGRNPARIVEIARGFGSAEVEKDTSGDPSITGRMNGVRYVIRFGGCKEGRNCTHMIFRAGWNNAKAKLEDVNAYNAGKFFGVVYIDKDGDVNVDMPVNLAGGVSRKNLDDTFDWWRLVLRDVVAAFIDKKA